MHCGYMGIDNQKRRDEEDEINYLSIGPQISRVTEPAVRYAIRALQLPLGSRGLDVGCGLGIHTSWLAEAVSPDGHVTGVDISNESLARAEGMANKSNLRKQVSFRTGDAWDLPFEDDSFDWLWSADTFYLWWMVSDGSGRDSLSLMKELIRVVKPGGIIAFLFWSTQKLLPGHPLLEARLNATSAANFVGPHGIEQALHSSRALGWLQSADLKEPKVSTLVADFYPPLTEETREGLTATFKMLWSKARSEVTAEDWIEYLRLCSPKSSDFILDLPDFYAYIVYSLFSGRVEK